MMKRLQFTTRLSYVFIGLFIFTASLLQKPAYATSGTKVEAITNQPGDTIKVSLDEYENRFKYYDNHYILKDTLSREYIVSQAVLREPYPYLIVYFEEDLKIRYEEGRSDCDGFLGPFKEYRKNGIIRAEGFRIGHKRYGDWKFYDKRGKYKKLKHYRKIDPFMRLQGICGQINQYSKTDS